MISLFENRIDHLLACYTSLSDQPISFQLFFFYYLADITRLRYWFIIQRALSITFFFIIEWYYPYTQVTLCHRTLNFCERSVESPPNDAHFTGLSWRRPLNEPPKPPLAGTCSGSVSFPRKVSVLKIHQARCIFIIYHWYKQNRWLPVIRRKPLPLANCGLRTKCRLSKLQTRESWLSAFRICFTLSCYQ